MFRTASTTRALFVVVGSSAAHRVAVSTRRSSASKRDDHGRRITSPCTNSVTAPVVS